MYDNARNILFYINDFKNTPFKTTIPDPKNNVFTPLETSNYVNTPKTAVIHVTYTKEN